ncbi:hypothetical protein JCM17039_24450 [Blautia glucerasea]
MGEIKVSIQRIDSRILLQVGTEQIEISDYNLKSSADGTTELNVTISGNTTLFELSASLEEPTQ